jgi:putative ABC transport system substrate-binding protein
MRGLGYVEGKDFVLQIPDPQPDTNSIDQVSAAAQALIGRGADILVASITPAAVGARRATSTTPIVFANASDPVENGLAASLSHPGGNVTGLTRLSVEIVGKTFEILREIAPHVKRIGILSNPGAPRQMAMLAQVKDATRRAGVEMLLAEASSVHALDDALAGLAKRQAQALLALPDGFFFVQRERIARFALQHRLPSMFPNTEFVEAGGLAAYSASSVANYKAAAKFVDKILKGAKPAELPIEQPTLFEFAVNLATARKLGIPIPPAVLARADRVVE